MARLAGFLYALKDGFVSPELLSWHQSGAVLIMIILGGLGPMFSSGHDLGSAVSRAEYTPGPDQHPSYSVNGGTREGAESLMLQEWHHFFANTRRWRDLRKITVAQVHGDVYAAALMLMWACDLIVAAENTRFADVVGTRLGMCGVEYFAHPWEFGPRKTKEYLFTGDFISAADAEKAGLVNRVVPRERLEEETMALAQRIAERDPYALKLAKASVNETQDAQGWRQAMENAFKNYMLTIPHRIEMGTYGPAAREKAPKDRFGVLNKKAD